MKIGFLIPSLGTGKYRTTYIAIVAFLEQKGHQVIHPLAMTEEELFTATPERRGDFFSQYYSDVNKCDLILAECSLPCINMGYEIASATQQGKEIIILKAKDEELSFKNFDPLYFKKNIHTYEYLRHNLLETLADAIAYNPNQKYKKYNILFTPEMIAKLNEIAKKKNLPKSVYIRQLLEKGLASEE